MDVILVHVDGVKEYTFDQGVTTHGGEERSEQTLSPKERRWTWYLGKTGVGEVRPHPTPGWFLVLPVSVRLGDKGQGPQTEESPPTPHTPRDLPQSQEEDEDPGEGISTT